MEVVNKINPLDMPEILKSVLSYVGAGGSNNTKHLLKSRLVCRSWNEAAVKLIPPQEKTFLANPDLDFEREYQLSRVILHHNEFIPGVQLCLQLHISDDPFDSPRFQITDKSIDQLSIFIKETSRHCPVTKIHIASCMEIGHCSFWNLIKIAAPHLKELKTNARLQQSSVRLIRFTFRQGGEVSYFDNLEFPHLVNIEYSIPPPSMRATSVIPDLLITMIHKTSTTLKSLKLTDQPNRHPTIQEKVEGMQKILSQTTTTLNNLKKLVIMLYPNVEFINSLCATQFSSLECLVLHEPYSVHLQPEFQQLLTNKCPLLSQLEIRLMGVQDAPAPEEFEQLDLRGVRLPKIKNLALYSFSANSIRVMKTLWANSQIFPAVTHFITDFKTCICISKVPSIIELLQHGGEYEGLVYPVVTSLLIKGDHSSGFPDNTTFGLIAAKIWPNLTTLIIDKVHESYAEVVSSGILNNLLSMQVGITSLELRTNILRSVDDWLSEIFTANPILEPLKENLQVLILSLPRDFKQQSNNPRDISKTLLSICEAFPNLQKLRLDECLLNNQEQRSLDQLLQPRRLKSRFPNIKFEIL